MAEHIEDRSKTSPSSVRFATSSCRIMPWFGPFWEALSRIAIRGLRNRRL